MILFGLRNAFSNVGTFVGNIFKTMANGFIDSLNFMIRAVNKLPKVDIDIVEKYELGTYKSLTKTGEAAASYKAAKSETHTQMIGQYASGGIATKASIFGEAGREIAIPLKKTARSKSLLNQADTIINGGKNGGVVVNVTIQGNVIGNEEYAEYIGEHIGNKIQLALGNM